MQIQVRCPEEKIIVGHIECGDGRKTITAQMLYQRFVPVDEPYQIKSQLQRGTFPCPRCGNPLALVGDRVETKESPPTLSKYSGAKPAPIVDTEVVIDIGRTKVGVK